MSATTLRHTTELVTTSCWCGIAHAVPESLYRIAQKNHKHTIYCPLGHEWVIGGKTEAEKLKEQLDDERARSARITADLDQVEASLRATKGVVTRLKNRAIAGVCPCCSRTFKQLASHMANKHPGYEATA